DMIDDPGEMADLADNPDFQEVMEKHRKLLQEWMTETNDDFRQFSKRPFSLEGQNLY
ncbi:unnamed protein product, partial [marine sediment metagenome]